MCLYDGSDLLVKEGKVVFWDFGIKCLSYLGWYFRLFLNCVGYEVYVYFRVGGCWWYIGIKEGLLFFLLWGYYKFKKVMCVCVYNYDSSIYENLVFFGLYSVN